MDHDILASLRRLPDAALVARVKDLVARERGATALLVAHLAELDTRDVHLREGHSSLFAYCRDALALSEHEAYNRIEAARAARRFPVILDLLEEGAVNLTAVRLLAPHLTAQNHRRVLESARGKRKPEVEELVARLAPRPDVPSAVRRLPAPVSPPSSGTRAASLPIPDPSAAAALTKAPDFSAAHAALVPSPPLSVATSGPNRPSAAAVMPLSPDRYKLQVTIGGATLEKLRQARDLLRHAVPSGDEATILDRALSALLVELARRKHASTPQPRRPRGMEPAAGESRHLPAAVRRAVWRRDLGRCAFVGASGRRCPERAFLEFHHLRPYGVGGPGTVENIQLRCRRHNAYEAKIFYEPYRAYAPVPATMP
jgi:hypothetical protein